MSSLAVAGAIALVAPMAPCDLENIEATLLSNSTIAAEVKRSKEQCKQDTGVDIFAITEFLTNATASEFQQSNKGCNILINLVNGYTNVNTQCTIVVNGTEKVYGRLISDFLDGKTGNETDSSSDSASESTSASSSASESGSNSSLASASTSGSSTTALSIVTYGAIAAIAVALR